MGDKGSAYLHHAGTKKYVRAIKKGECFGEYSFFTNTPFHYKLLADDFCIISSINR